MSYPIVLLSLFGIFILPIASTPLFASTKHNILSLTLTPAQQNESETYWTESRLKNARPLPLPQATPGVQQAIPLTALKVINDSAIGKSEDGLPPLAGLKPNLQHLFNIDESPTARSSRSLYTSGDSPQTSSMRHHYLVRASDNYPYSAVGKLYFNVPGTGDFVCSATVIKPRVILTAGHCVHKGFGGSTGFYNHWRFVPAFRSGDAPLQAWTASAVHTTVTWSSGGAKMPNAADYAMIEIADQVVGRALHKMGEVTGYIGYQTLALLPDRAQWLGYPCNSQRCQNMHLINAQRARAVAPNNVEYDSELRDGLSGGPWMQQYDTSTVDEIFGENEGVKRVIGVTSYSYAGRDPKSQGVSIFDRRFTDLLEVVCDGHLGNC